MPVSKSDAEFIQKIAREQGKIRRDFEGHKKECKRGIKILGDQMAELQARDDEVLKSITPEKKVVNLSSNILHLEREDAKRSSIKIEFFEHVNMKANERVDSGVRFMSDFEHLLEKYRIRKIDGFFIDSR